MPLPPPTACTECTDERNNYMQSNDLVCGQYPYAYEKLCKHNENWVQKRFCQRSCYANGAGYDGDVRRVLRRAASTHAVAFLQGRDRQAELQSH